MSIARKQINSSNSSQIIIITPGKYTFNYWIDIWRFKELLLLLAWRDVLVRYKQTAFGLAWALIRPVTTVFVFTLIFGKIANLPSQNIPYPLLVFSGVLAWQFFSSTFSDAANSIVDNSNLISKVYFPRIIIPLSVLFVGLVDLVVTVLIYLILALWYNHLPDWRIVFLPLFIVLLFIFVFATALWFSALNVKYRDFRYILPFLLQLGSYASPVGFSSSIVPNKWQFIYSLNPLVGIIDGFRWCLLRGDNGPLDFVSLSLSVVVTFFILIPGIKFFKHQERQFADVI